MMTGISERLAGLRRVCPLLLACATLGATAAETDPAFGEPATAAEIARHDTMVFPDGAGLPPGHGDAATGAALYAKKHCIACHGQGGRGGPSGELAGGTEPLTSDTPDQTIGTYWPYATTLFDFIRRAMPLHAPGSLSDDEVYALCAYLLAENGIIAPDAELDAASLAAITMPNRDGFIWLDAPRR
jgi:cytochrome c